LADSAGYQVLDEHLRPLPGFEAPVETIAFDRGVPGPAAPGLAYSEGSGVTAYGNRVTHFSYVVTNTVRDDAATGGLGHDLASAWQLRRPRGCP